MFTAGVLIAGCFLQGAYCTVFPADAVTTEGGCLLQGAYQRALTAKMWSGKRQVKEPDVKYESTPYNHGGCEYP